MGEPAAAFTSRPRRASPTTSTALASAPGSRQKDAGARAALTPARLDKIEAGETIPSFDVLIRITGAYSTSVGELVEGVTWKPGWVEDSGPAEYRVIE